MSLEQFRSDSKKFAEITGKPLVLDTFITALVLRPVINILRTNAPFEKFQDDNNITMREHMNMFGQEAVEILKKYVLQADDLKHRVVWRDDNY